MLYSQPFFAGSIVAGSAHVASTVSANRTPQPGEWAAAGWWPAGWLDVQARAAAANVTMAVRHRASLRVMSGLPGTLGRT